MHTYNIRIMISTIYAEDREDMESIFVSKNSAIIKQEKTLLTFTLRWLWDLWIIFHFFFGIKEIEIEFALYDNDRIAKIEILFFYYWKYIYASFVFNFFQYPHKEYSYNSKTRMKTHAKESIWMILLQLTYKDR